MPNAESEVVLLVEGQDDMHVVRQLCNRYQSMPEFAIHVTGDDRKLLDAIGPAMLVSGRTAVGVLVDADDDPDSRWVELRSRLLEEGITTPDRPSPDGTIIDIGVNPRIGIRVMPDNWSLGEIEDFVQGMIPQDDPVWPRSERYVDDIPAEYRKFRPGKLLRAKLYAWLATREIPGRMGAAIGADDLDAQAANSVRFMDWLWDLFA